MHPTLLVYLLLNGRHGAQVEILLPEFWDPASGPVFAEEGDQQRFWKLTRRFIDSLAQGSNSKNIKAVSHRLFALPCLRVHLLDAHSVLISHFMTQVQSGSDQTIPTYVLLQIYPDMGVAAMLKNQWQDAGFRFASLSDRNPVSEDDDLIVLAAPDPQG